MWYAHSIDKKSEENWQTLKCHLEDTARKAQCFSAAFGAGDWGWIAGLLHDAGKYTQAFQRRLRGDPRRVDHSTEGGRIAIEAYGGQLGKLLAYVVLGHHGHLPNAGSLQQSSSLRLRLAAHPQATSAFLTEHELPAPPPLPSLTKEQCGFQLAFFTRMLYSCLVDADCLDTEAFVDSARAEERNAVAYAEAGQWMGRCKELLDAYLAHLSARAPATAVNAQRAAVLQACCEAAHQPPGLFSLTVPTGGGKTLASLAFALDHARLYGKRRVICVAPFTSIIEQTADVYRGILGAEAVLEHHSAVETRTGDSEEDEDEELTRQMRLATENWDRPIVVTTAVQFFESLFASRKWRCRKLHNIAGAVIILDEAQTLPDGLLRPTLAALETLCAHYGCTVVLCTATQPALDALWSPGIRPREIMPEPETLYRALRRTRVEKLGRLNIGEVTERLRLHRQALCIVSTRARARELYQRLRGQSNVYHLSTCMCAQHRSETLEMIRGHLKRKEPCIVCSTQLVEAGVDLDFEAVYREMAGIDSIAQAAGRCNREGRNPEGTVYLYEPEEGLPRGWIRRCASIAGTVVEQYDDPLSLEAVRSYSRKRFALQGAEALDEKGILKGLNNLDKLRALDFEFRDIARDYRWIEEEGETVYVPYGAEGRARVEAVRRSETPGALMRGLQRYGVHVYGQEYARMRGQGWIDLLHGLYPVLSQAVAHHYTAEIGLEPLDERMETGFLSV